MVPTQVPNLFKSSRRTAANRDTVQYCTESKPGPDQCCNNLSNWRLVSLLANLDAHLEALRSNGTPSLSLLIFIAWSHRNFIITHYSTSTHLHAIAILFVWKLPPRIPSGVSGLAGRQRKAATRKRHVKMNIYSNTNCMSIKICVCNMLDINTLQLHQVMPLKHKTKDFHVSKKKTIANIYKWFRAVNVFHSCHSIRRWIPQHQNCKQAQKQTRTQDDTSLFG